MHINGIERTSLQICNIFETSELLREVESLSQDLERQWTAYVPSTAQPFELKSVYHFYEDFGIPHIRHCYIRYCDAGQAVVICLELRAHRLGAYVGVADLAHWPHQDCAPGQLEADSGDLAFVAHGAAAQVITKAHQRAQALLQAIGAGIADLPLPGISTAELVRPSQQHVLRPPA
jgi:hypothetical protein